MDVYDPASGEVSSAGTDGVAAWFLDTDYDRRSFLVSQAFFPGSAGGADPWARLGRALRGWVDPDAFEMLRGTTSLPFSAGEHGRAAIKVIDFRGNEAIKILDLPTAMTHSHQLETSRPAIRPTIDIHPTQSRITT